MSMLWPGRRPPPLEALDRSGEVGGTSPPRSVGQIESPRYPTEPHFATQSGRKWDTIRRTELLRAGRNRYKRLVRAVQVLRTNGGGEGQRPWICNRGCRVPAPERNQQLVNARFRIPKANVHGPAIWPPSLPVVGARDARGSERPEQGVR